MPSRLHIRAQSVLAILLILGFILVATLAEVIAPTIGELVDGVQLAGSSSNLQPRPPSPDAPLGTTPGQMDIYYALVHGFRDARKILDLIVILRSLLIG